MIPKIIHYCWFGNQPIPNHLQGCMLTWRKILPDYTFIRWDESNFDINSTIWTKEAYNARKFAFVSDYVRLVALQTMGGIYLDTDVVVKKTFNSLLNKHAFMGFENELYLTSAVMGFEPNFPLINEFLKFYEGKHFILEDGQLNNTANVIMMTEICKKYGLRIEDSYQETGDISFFPREFFCPLDFYHNNHATSNTMTIHLFDASWLDKDTKSSIVIERKSFYKIFIKFKSFLKRIIMWMR